MMNRREKNIRMVFGTVFSPLDSLFGFFKGFYWWGQAAYSTFSWRKPSTWFKAPFAYFYAGLNPVTKINPPEVNTTRDKAAKTVSGIYSLSRIGGVCLTVLSVLGFAGLLAFPGTAPVALAFLPILKAVGITTLWATAGRWVGALIGSAIDNYKLKKVHTTIAESVSTVDISARQTAARVQKVTTGWYVFRKACLVGMLGEAAGIITQPPISPDSPRRSLIRSISAASSSDGPPPWRGGKKSEPVKIPSQSSSAFAGNPTTLTGSWSQNGVRRLPETVFEDLFSATPPSYGSTPSLPKS